LPVYTSCGIKDKRSSESLLRCIIPSHVSDPRHRNGRDVVHRTLALGLARILRDNESGRKCVVAPNTHRIIRIGQYEDATEVAALIETGALSEKLLNPLALGAVEIRNSMRAVEANGS